MGVYNRPMHACNIFCSVISSMFSSLQPGDVSHNNVIINVVIYYVYSMQEVLNQ